MTLPPHAYWQEILPPGTWPDTDATGYDATYPATLPDGRQIPFPIRTLPAGDRRVASLILNQASFAVADALADVLADALRPIDPDVVVGVPTLGLGLADAVARKLGHARLVPLGTSVKFWYDPALSVPTRSITSPGQEKRLYLDPRMLPLVQGGSVVVVDDVISTGATTSAVLDLCDKAGVAPVALGYAMAQGSAWRGMLAERGLGALPVLFSVATPVFDIAADGRSVPRRG